MTLRLRLLSLMAAAFLLATATGVQSLAAGTADLDIFFTANTFGVHSPCPT